MRREPALSSAESHLALDTVDFRELICSHKHPQLLTSHQKVLLTYHVEALKPPFFVLFTTGKRSNL